MREATFTLIKRNHLSFHKRLTQRRPLSQTVEDKGRQQSPYTRPDRNWKGQKFQRYVLGGEETMPHPDPVLAWGRWGSLNAGDNPCMPNPGRDKGSWPNTGWPTQIPFQLAQCWKLYPQLPSGSSLRSYWLQTLRFPSIPGVPPILPGEFHSEARTLLASPRSRKRSARLRPNPGHGPHDSESRHRSPAPLPEALPTAPSPVPAFQPRARAVFRQPGCSCTGARVK